MEDKDINIKIGATIRKYRVLAGMSLSELANHLGISYQQVQKYEKGTNRLLLVRLIHIARVLDCSVAQFIAEIDDSKHCPDTSQLIQAYHSIPDPKVRKLLLHLLKRLIENPYFCRS